MEKEVKMVKGGRRKVKGVRCKADGNRYSIYNLQFTNPGNVLA